ncbi:MAG: tRNA adenosine(34) deaminase TadA [Legionellaceae bacterium]|nr:tRNA adenosine(34) deaminase TadA [Legionellaceae bacterium]
MGVNDLAWMKQAYALALKAEKVGEVPVGAVLVSENNQLLGSGFNQTMTQNDPTGHAEVVAIRAASQKLHNYRLLNTTLYVTLEPCVMCAGALLQARVTRLVFATRDLKAGATGSVYNLLNTDILNHKIQIDEGILQNECAVLLSTFFQKRR